MTAASSGEGWAATNIDDLGAGPGFRKIRGAIGVTAFGINAIVLPAGAETGRHYHDRQQEVYFLHAGRIEMEFGDGATHTLEAGGVAAATIERMAARALTSSPGSAPRPRWGRARRVRRSRRRR